MGFPKQEYWSALLFPSPGDLPNPGIELGSPVLLADSLPSEPPGKICRLFPNKVIVTGTGDEDLSLFGRTQFNS